MKIVGTLDSYKTVDKYFKENYVRDIDECRKNFPSSSSVFFSTSSMKWEKKYFNLISSSTYYLRQIHLFTEDIIVEVKFLLNATSFHLRYFHIYRYIYIFIFQKISTLITPSDLKLNSCLKTLTIFRNRIFLISFSR